MSRSFIAALCGLGLTLFSWYSSWQWPAWPALTAMSLLFGGGAGFADLPYAVRAGALVALIILNAAFWGVLAWAAMSLVRRLRSRLPFTPRR